MTKQSKKATSCKRKYTSVVLLITLLVSILGYPSNAKVVPLIKLSDNLYTPTKNMVIYVDNYMITSQNVSEIEAVKEDRDFWKEKYLNSDKNARIEGACVGGLVVYAIMSLAHK